jgi:predicted DNA-binding transcriptional regulator YafY
MPQPASRLITLIMLLQSQPNQKAADLARKLDISVRTLHRYFSMLDEMGIPVFTERGPHGGFSLVRGYKMPPLVFSPEEAAAVSLGTSLVEEMWGSLYQEAAQGALAKLENVLPDEQRQEVAWARRSLVATGLHRIHLSTLTPLLERLRHAVHEHQQIRILYRNSSHNTSLSRDVDPYALVHRRGWWYLVGYCHLRQAERSFRVDRILACSLTGSVFEVPTCFEIHKYLAGEFHEQPNLRVRMRFLPQAAVAALANRSFWETLEEEADGSVVVTFLAPDLIWAASSAFLYGPAVMVLEPPDLQHMLHDWAQTVAGFYPPTDIDSENS